MEAAAIEAEVLARAEAAGAPLWRFSDASVEVGPMFARVRNGRVVSWGIEPLGEVLVAADGKVTAFASEVHRRLRRSALLAAVGAAAAGAAGAAAAAITVARARHRPA